MSEIRLYYFENRKTTTGYNITYKKGSAYRSHETFRLDRLLFHIQNFNLEIALLVAAKPLAETKKNLKAKT